MFKIFKGYIKYKLLSLVKDRYYHYSSEVFTYYRRRKEWEQKEFKETCKSGQCRKPDGWAEKERESQIKFSNDQYRINQNKLDAVKEILEIIEKL